MNNSVKIIAEAAQGYEGKIEQALLLAKGAIAVGADAIKFQLVFADELATPDYHWYNLFKELEMSLEEWTKIADLVNESKDCQLIFDVFGDKSLEYAKCLGASGVKIHTTDFYNHNLVQDVLKNFSEVYIAFGGMNISEIHRFLAKHSNYLSDRNKRVVFLYGFQAEPTKIESNNLLRIRSLQKEFPQCEFGFMDHEDGDSPYSQTLSLLAMGLGVRYLEKHITLDRELRIEDYVSGLSFRDFQSFVKQIRYHEKALGKPSLTVSQEEKEYRKKAAKVIVSKRDLLPNHVLGISDLQLKRTAKGFTDEAILDIEQVIGRTLRNKISKDIEVKLEDLL